MGFNRILQWLLPVLIPLFLVTGCGDLEPEMQDTRTVILNMDFDQRSSSRTSSFSPADLGNYQTHLIMVLTSDGHGPDFNKILSNSSYWDYRSNQGEYVLYDSDRKITLNMKLNTKMKIFAFLFTENYSHYERPLDHLFSAKPEAGYYGESQILEILDPQPDSLEANIILNQVPGTGTDTGGGTDTTAPTASVTAATITPSGNAVVRSTETGTAYLVNTTVTVSNLVSITGAADNKWNSVAISSADTDTNLAATGLADGTYKVYAIDAAGNLSSASSNSVNVATDYALDFDGTNDYVSADGVATELDSSTNLPLSVSAWVYPENGTKEQLVFGFYKYNAFANGPSVWFGGTDFSFAYYNKSLTTVHSSSTYAINNWHHVVLTIGSDRDGVLYVNGSPALTFSGAYNSGSLDMFSIAVDYDNSGGSAGNPAQYFDGKIDEVAVWNVALNAADVTSLYNSRNGLKASANSGNYDNSGDLIGYWKFNEGTGSTLTDKTSNSNNGTLINMDSSDWVTSGLNLID